MKRNPFIDSIDVSTRRKRRAATSLALALLGKIHLAEIEYQERIPFNLQGSCVYAASDDTIDSLVEAMVVLMNAFD